MCTSRLHLARNRVRAASLLLTVAMAMLAWAVAAVDEAEQEHETLAADRRDMLAERYERHDVDEDQAPDVDEDQDVPPALQRAAWRSAERRGGRRRHEAG